MGEANIAEDLLALKVPIDSLRQHPENARRGDVEALASSLIRFGQLRPILATPDGTIVAGWHLYLAAQRLGWEEIAVARADLSPEEARAYLVADNRLAELGDYDQEALGSLLSSLGTEDALLGTGFDDDAVAAIMAKLNPDPPEFKEHGADIETDRECPKCGFTWSSGGG